MQLNLQGLTEEELVNLRTQINDRISAMRKMDREEETSLFRSRYEGKYFLHADGTIYHILEIIDKYVALVWIFEVEKEDDFFNVSISKENLRGLFTPKNTMMGHQMEPSVISLCEEISIEEAKNIILPYFNQIRLEFFEE